MAADDHVTDSERARLQIVAWGSGSSPAEAARARIALADLDRRPAQRTPTSPQHTPVTSTDTTPRPIEPAAGSAAQTEAVVSSDAPVAVPSTHAWAATSVDQGESGLQAEQTGRTEQSGRAERADAPVATSRWERVRDRAVRIVRSARARPWLAGGAAAAVVVAFGTGLVVGTVHPALPASPTVSPTPGTVTLEQLLDAPQTYADQLPGSVEAPVKLHSTRLVFTNRSLSGDDAATPWNVWAAVGNDRSTICLVATANRIEATSACYPREDALHGSVSLTAQSLSGTLIVELSGGGVQGRVATAF